MKFLKRLLISPIVFLVNNLESFVWVISGNRMQYGAWVNKLAKWVKK